MNDSFNDQEADAFESVGLFVLLKQGAGYVAYWGRTGLASPLHPLRLYWMVQHPLHWLFTTVIGCIILSIGTIQLEDAIPLLVKRALFSSLLR